MPRFQAIAPSSPVKTTVGVIAAASTTSPATVAATATEMNAPAKLSSAATAIATCGGATPVETAVEIRSKVSWKPLLKAKQSAATTTRTMAASELTSS